MSPAPAAALRPGTSTTDAPRHRFAIFAFLAALAVVVDHVRLATLTSPLRAATVIAAAAVMHRPASARRFLALVALLTMSLWQRLPRIDNLQMLLLLLGVTLLATFAVAAGRARGLPAGPGWMAEFEPLVRAATVAVYALTFWHKLNHDFLAPERSCGVFLWDNMRAQDWMPGALLPPGAALAPLLIYGTLALEAGIPLLLAFARTARAGIAVALGFHYLLGLARFYEFSTMALALLFLFAPPAATPALVAWWRRTDRRRLLLAAAALAALFAVAASVQSVLLWDPSIPLRRNVRVVGHLVLAYGWWLSAIPIALFLRQLWRLPADAAPPRPRFAPSHPLLAAAPLLVVLNGISPYLGFKTEHSFAMYSNLRTEGGSSNHLLLPAPLALAGYQRELVRVLETTDRRLAKASRGGQPVPFAVVRRVAHFGGEPDAPARIVYERDGVVYEVPPLDADPALRRPNVWERKLLHFRDVQASPVACGH